VAFRFCRVLRYDVGRRDRSVLGPLAHRPPGAHQLHRQGDPGAEPDQRRRRHDGAGDRDGALSLYGDQVATVAT